jgi:HlyD family secretion protein
MDDERRTEPGTDMAALLRLGAAPDGLREKRWWIVGGIFVVVVAGVLAWRLLGGPAGPSYRMAEITTGALTATVTATGTLQPVNTVDIGPEISGQIETVNVDYNDRVVAGQVLAVMDTDVLKAKVL